MSDAIDRQAAIASAISGRVRALPTSEDGEDWIRTSEVRESLLNLPSAQPEPWEDERKKIADALSEKMAYMNTCLNTRDTILGYLGVERPIEIHCNSDCRNEKCESYHYATKELPAAQPEIIRCKDCAYYDKDYSDELSDWCHVWSETTRYDGYCHEAEPYKGEQE